MPDINGQRMILNISTQQTFPIQCVDTSTNEEIITIGKYHFFAAVFQKANAILLQALDVKPQWLVIDEIGKLEMQGKGFYESVKLIIDYYIINYFEQTNFNLLLVVRDSLVNEVVDFFGIKGYKLVHELGI
jgi:nucleoside-triphosphatase THEP1